jgi:hypothetical protein
MIEVRPYGWYFMPTLTFHATRIRAIAVQFDDLVIGNARALMKIVDVLRYDRTHLPTPNTFCDETMGRSGTEMAIDVVHRKFASPRLDARFCTGHVILKRNGLVRQPWTAG